MGTMKGGGAGGEIVQVQGGHIIRSTGRKDRHSKVYTAKGPRDRRVRLAAHTAIQFYDVQDRLGYDRPSKAVDWLIKKAKHAIDKLAQLPPFNPNGVNSNGLEPNVHLSPTDLAVAGGGGGGGEQSDSGYEIQLQAHHQPPPAGLDSQSFFPSTSTENSMGFQGYPHQDLCLSLQSFQNTGFIHSQSEPGNSNTSQTLFPTVFDVGSSAAGEWSSETNPAEMGRFSRLLAWNGGGGGGGVEAYGVGGSERGTLQSSFHPPPSIRVWDDLPMGSIGDPHHHRLKTEQQGGIQHHQAPSMAGIGVLGSDGFMGFCVPPQMHGGSGSGQEVHGIISHHHHRASSMSTDSSH